MPDFANHLETTAAQLERQARDLRRQATAERDKLANRRLLELFADLGRQAALAPRPDVERWRLSVEHGVKQETIAVWQAKAEKRDAKAMRAVRDRQIMRLWQLGWSLEKIGKRVGLHPKSVARRVRLARQAARRQGITDF